MGTKKVFSKVPPSLTPPTDTTRLVRTGKQEMVMVKTRRTINNSVLIFGRMSIKFLLFSLSNGGVLGKSGSDSGFGFLVENKLAFSRTHLLLTK